ncbi:S-layer homology domain-containing protein [Patescibacteria group bacterium]|nr:S-layer homology domain-containing protein [Patescibacteria group bacterium]
MLGNQLSSLDLAVFKIPEAHAQTGGALTRFLTPTPPKAELGIVAILVENDLLEDSESYETDGEDSALEEHIFTYAENIQNRLPHTRAIVIGVNSNESTYKIATVLEKLYYEGADNDLLDTNPLNDDFKREDDNQLVGIVLVGDVPIPVIHEEEGDTAPSLYPYTDFYRKRYLYNHDTDRFEYNDAALNPTPEIWHGVIVPPSKNKAKGRQELADYFYKNNQYSKGAAEYNTFNQRLLYYNFPAIDEKLNTFDYNNYKRSVAYSEEIAFKRLNRHLLREMVQEVAAEMEPDKDPDQRTPLIDDVSIASMSDSTTAEIIKKFTNQENMANPTPNFVQALKSYIGRLNPIIARTGRWSEQEYDSLASLIALRDSYMQNTLMAKGIELENQINAVIRNVQQQAPVITGIEIKTTECETEACHVIDEIETFDFVAFTGGQMVSTMASAEQCGLTRGQKAPAGVPPAKNNSVLVEANHLYNPDSALIPDPEDDDPPPLEEMEEYINYGGCVANNLYELDIDVDGDRMERGPRFCKPEEAYWSIVDLAGSKEKELEFYTPAVPEPDEATGEIPWRCSVENMSFLPLPRPSGELDEWYDRQNVTDNRETTLRIAINSVYQSMVDAGEIIDPMPEEVLYDPTYFVDYLSPHRRLQLVVHAMLANGNTAMRPFYDGNNSYVAFQITATTANKYSLIRHTEPTTQTLRNVKKFMTPNTPADGIRSVEFYRNGQRQLFEYPNLFRLPGNNPEDIAGSLLQMIQAKDSELNQLLGYDANIILQFFGQNPDLTEPILWRKMGIDQKHQLILEKYVNRDSFLPVPDSNLPVPATKPDGGYEVLHVLAEGDAQGFQFAINASRLTEAELYDAEMEAAKKEIEDATDGGDDEGDDGDGGLDSGLVYSCGPPDGVEIWEWFDAVYCWIEEEISQLGEMLSLDNVCGGGDLPEPEEIILEDTSKAMEDPNSVPVKLDVTVERGTLVRGESVEVKAKVLNSEEEAIVGYLENPLAFGLADDGIGHFDQDELEVFTGFGKVNLIAEDVPGSTQLTVRLGNLIAPPIPIRVVEYISVNLSAVRQTDTRPTYKITATLVDPEGNPISNINTKLRVRTVKPSDGLFERGGLVQIENGRGETVFYPNPTSLEMDLKAQHPVYQNDLLHISQPPGQPARIMINAPKELPIGKKVNLPIRVTDVFGNTTPIFNEPVQIKITDVTQKYGTLASGTVVITEGVGIATVNVGTETAPLNLVASHEALAPGIAELSIVAKVTSEEWAKTYPQNLFASFVGFPAGNFLEDDYFAGAHLFNGKTEAAFAFMSDAPVEPEAIIHPNYYIETFRPRHTVTIDALGDELAVQIVDQKNLRTLAATTAPLDFENIALWDEDEIPIPGTIYFERTNPNYAVDPTQNAIYLTDPDGNPVLTIKKDYLDFKNYDYRLVYETEPDEDWMELVLVGVLGEIGRLRLLFNPRTINSNYVEIHPELKATKQFAGKSTQDASGLMLFIPPEEKDEDAMPSENFGFEGDNKYILRFAGGSPAGEATMFNLPPNAVLLGDPTIQLDNPIASSLNYDNTLGRQIYQDSEESDIASLTNFDFDNDDMEDVAAVMKDGRIRLFKQGATDPIIQDRGDIAFMGDGALSIIPFDFKNDGYDDLLVATDEGRLAILHNNQETITRSDIKIKVGKKLYQILKADMDADSYPDLVTVDSRGDIRIFYNQSSELLRQGAVLPIPAEDQIPENGVFIGNYGFSLQLGQNLKNGLQIRFPGMPQPDGSTADPPPPPEPTPPSDNPYGLPTIIIPETPSTDALENFAGRDTSNDLNEDEIKSHISDLRQETEAMQESGQPADSNTLPWKEGDENEVYFAQLEDFEINNSAFHNGLYLSVTKTVENRDRPAEKNLDLGEKLLYTIVLQASKNVNDFVLADTVPDALVADDKSVKCEGVGCERFKDDKKDIYLFVSQLDLKANQPIEITYEANVKHTPKPGISLRLISEPTTLIGQDQAGNPIPFQAPLDAYTDIMVSPTYNTSGQLAAHYSVAPRAYRLAATQPAEMDEALGDALDGHSDCIAALEGLQNMTFDEDNPPPENFMDGIMEACGMDEISNALNDPGKSFAGDDVLTPEECAANPTACAGNALDDLMSSIANLSCMGGGCFPMPFNMAFMAPQSIPMAMPLISFPATLPTPVGPIPFPSFFALAPTALGATSIPGTYNSMIRFYMVPTLTGGIGLSLCWLNYMGDSTVPPPLIPIPYPPPIGNCMTFALPMSEAPPCKLLAQLMDKIMATLNNIVSDINSGVSAVNSSGLPGEIQSAQDQGSGGLEISLAINLGDQMKFEPPVKGFSNLHIGSFDSIGGAIASWVDRQTLEILNKLLTMPTIRVILPDVGALFGSDWDEFNKLVEAFGNNLDKSNIKEEKTEGNVDEEKAEIEGDIGSEIPWLSAAQIKDLIQNLEKGALESNFLKNYEAIEREIRNTSTSPFEQVFQIANAIPFVNINQHNIDLKIPWLSFGQIQDFIRDLEQVRHFYEKRLDTWEDQLEKFQCPDNEDTCAGKKILEIFIVDLDAFINSITQNIEVVQSYLRFPRDFILMKKELADYLRQIACYLDTYSDMLGGWLTTIQQQVIGYAELWYTILEIIDQIEKMIDVFTNFEDNCDICTNERFGNFGYFTLLGLILPDIPIIKFPKWPDLVIDFSDLKGSIDIEMPMIHFVLEPITLPSIPKIPFPDIPTDLSLLTQLPPLPILPGLPELPELPPLPAIPTIDLPTLPPPPKLPDIGKDFKFIIPLVEKILEIWCLIKKSFSPIPEAYMADHVVLLTNRPSYMIPLDFLKPKIGDIAPIDLGFNELRIETTIYLGVRLKGALEKLQEGADVWNNMATDWAGYLDEKISAELQKMAEDINQGTQWFEDNADPQKLEDWYEDHVSRVVYETAQREFEAIDQKYRDIEERMQGYSDWLEDNMQEGMDDANQAWVNAMNEANKAMDEAGREWADELHEAFLAFHWDPFEGIQQLMKALDEADIDIGDEMQDALNTVGKELGKLVAEGVLWTQEQVEEFRKKLNEWFGADTPDWVLEFLESLDEGMGEAEGAYDDLTAVPQIPGNLQKLLAGQFAQLADIINTINETEVDYTVVKEALNVPDFTLPPQLSAIAKIKTIRHDLLAYSDQLDGEAIEMENANDMLAYIQNQASIPSPFEVADLAAPAIEPAFSSVAPSSGNSAPSAPTPPTLPTAGSDTSSSLCSGTCLVDPDTGYLVQFIPYFDNPNTSKTAFVHSGINGHSHVVYSDGPNLYLKRDLEVPLNITENIAPSVPNTAFDLNHFISFGNTVMPLEESANMMSITLTENSAASFEWLESTHPDVYGYGIELERSILGYDADKQQNGLADVTIVLLPPTEDGLLPEVTVGGQPIQYGTLATSFTDPEEARERFGIQARNIVTGGDMVVFKTVGNAAITLKPTRAVYFDQYTGPSFRMNMDNGFYHIKMTWFDEFGRTANYNRSELLSPQVYVPAPPPIDVRFNKKFLFPIYKEGTIHANDIFMDLSGAYQYYWDFNQDGLPEQIGPEIILPAQKAPKEFTATLIASKNLEDESFDRHEKSFKVEIYVPKINIEQEPLALDSIVQGNMTPKQEGDDLSEIPFSLFRKRWGTWKNLGFLKRVAGEETIPPLNSQFGWENNYYSITAEGDYSINGFSRGPASVIVRDEGGREIARVHLETGQAEILNPNYELKAVPASRELPTRIIVLKKGFDTVIFNAYYISDVNNDILILDEPLDQENVEAIGVTIGDRNLADTIIARNMPGYAESYPGGAAIFNDATQLNIALINSDGAVRMMQKGYGFRLKNEGILFERVIFEIFDEATGAPVFDVFIRANFNNLEIRQDELWNEIKTTIGYLKETIKPLFASLIAQAPPAPESPFPDLDASHPFYQQILDLYKRRIVSGYGDGTFQPDAKLSRAEFVKIALGATNCFDCSRPSDPVKEKYTGTPPFPDVYLPAWYFYCIAIAKDLSMITGYGDGFFRPGQNISRAEAAAILLRQSGIEIQEAPEEAFIDVPDYAWYKDYVYTAVEIGLVQNQLGFVFPDEEITRGEFAFMASSILSLQDCKLVDSDEDGMPDWWEMENNLDPLYAGDAPLDNDEDGFSNLNEFRMGTDPNDPSDPGYIPPDEICPCLDNPNQNDTDDDGIIDACDEDLDNDGVKNVMCLFDDNGLVDPEKAAESDDNCIFVGNAPQTDQDTDGVGDACYPVDQCPEIPEDIDGINDLDGCPEVYDETADSSDRIAENLPGVYVNGGPACNFLDYEADLVDGDIIMTAITDVDTHEVIYERSGEITY